MTFPSILLSGNSSFSHVFETFLVASLEVHCKRVYLHFLFPSLFIVTVEGSRLYYIAIWVEQFISAHFGCICVHACSASKMSFGFILLLMCVLPLLCSIWVL